jgi:ABC-type multidrug transport system permease subunit
MKLTLTTPALIFSTISLLLLAYTNRFMGIAALIRNLHEKAKKAGEKDQIIVSQISTLKKRVKLIRNMQFMAILSLFFCVFSMFLLFFGKTLFGELIFAVGLLLLMVSLLLSAIEINISVHALSIQLSECIGDECFLDESEIEKKQGFILNLESDMANK